MLDTILEHRRYLHDAIQTCYLDYKMFPRKREQIDELLKELLEQLKISSDDLKEYLDKE